MSQIEQDPIPGQVTGKDELGQLGFKQELGRRLGVLGNVTIAVSDISPTTGVFMQLAVVIILAGTGAFWAYVLGGVIAICMALTMGETGSRYPLAGGLYSIVLRVLGRPLGFAAFIDYLFQGAFVPGTVGLATATYLAPVIGVPVLVLAPITMALAVIVALLHINLGAKFVGVFLALELIVIGVITVVSFAHPVQPLSVLFKPIIFDSASSAASPVGPGIILAAITIALFSFNGYDSALNLSEETSGAARNVGKACFTSAWLGVAFQIVALVAILLTAPRLSTLITSESPMMYIGKARLGTGFGTLLNLGVAVAMFNCTIACVIQFARVLYSSGRDMAWPAPVSRALTTVSRRTQVPWVATLVIGFIAGVLAFFGSLLALVTFGAVLIVALYALIAVANIVDRVRRGAPPFKMPLWPLPVVVVLVGCVAALTQITARDVLIVAVIFGVGMLYYVAYLRPRGATHWVKTEEESVPSGASEADVTTIE